MRWFAALGRRRPAPPPARPRPADPIAEHLHAAVSAHARAKADTVHAYEARVRAMTDDLLLRMDERHGRRAP